MQVPHLRRRPLLAAALLLPLAAMATPAQKSLPLIEVWKDPSCGCCKDWVAIVEQAGFPVRVFETGNNAMRAQLGIGPGSHIQFELRGRELVIKPEVPMSAYRGMLKPYNLDPADLEIEKEIDKTDRDFE